MSKTIGFVLNAPVNYSETFLLQEFSLLEKAGYKILIFEGYGSRRIPYHFKRIQSLPLQLKTFTEVIHTFKIFIRLIFSGFTPLVRFIYLELTSGTGLIRTLKRIWFNAHILSYQVDYLHFCFADVAIQKELTAQAIRAKMSVSLRGSDILVYPIKNRNCYHRLWEHADKVHAVSQYILKKSYELGLSLILNTKIIPDGVNASKIIFNSQDVHSPLRILSAGRLEPVKDFDLAVQVIKALAESTTNIEYTIIGGGSLKTALMKKVEELGIKEQVTFKGNLEHSQLLEIMPFYDMLLHTSKSEGLGVVLLEAQAAGLFTIALDAGGTEESIEDGKSGWIIRKRDPVVVAEKILDVLNLPASERINVKLYAKKRIEEKFEIRSLAKEWEKFFD